MRRIREKHYWEGNVDFWVSTLSELDSATKESVNQILEFLSFIPKATNLMEKILISKDFRSLRVDEILLEEIARKPIIAIDSSISPMVRVGAHFFTIISASIVYFENGKAKPSKNLIVKLIRVPELGRIEYVKKETLLRMFELEAEALEKATQKIDGGAIFIDGPLVDPPKFVVGGELRKAYENYVSRRARAIARAKRKNVLLIGITKRILGNHLVSNFKQLLKDFPWMNDHTFVTLIFSYIARRILRDSDISYYLLTKPLELSHEKTDYRLYKEYGSGKIFYSYACLNPQRFRGKIIGVESPAEADKVSDIFRIAMHYSIYWTYPGMNVPLPVILAHKTCTIRKRTARKILRELISRYISETLSGEDTYYISLITQRFIE